MQIKGEISKKLMARAMTCETADELMALAKSEGYEMTKEEAEAYVAELSDCELDESVLKNVSGGSKTCYVESSPGQCGVVSKY